MRKLILILLIVSFALGGDGTNDFKTNAGSTIANDDRIHFLDMSKINTSGALGKEYVTYINFYAKIFADIQADTMAVDTMAIDKLQVDSLLTYPTATIKIHRTTAQDTVVTSTWTNCSKFQVFSDETSGGIMTLSADSTTLTVARTGMYIFGGCIHFQNNSGGDKTPLVAMRLFQNDTTEMRCSQRAWNGTVKDGGENVLSYNGTASLESGNTVNLQYYTDDITIDFQSNAVFSNQIAYTLWFDYIGKK